MDYTYNQDINTTNTIDNQLCLQVDYANRSDFYYLPPNIDITTKKITVDEGWLYLDDKLDDMPMWCEFLDYDSDSDSDSDSALGVQTIDTYEVETDAGKFDTWDFNVLKITIYKIYDYDCGCYVIADMFYDDSYFDNDNQ